MEVNFFVLVLCRSVVVIVLRNNWNRQQCDK